MFAAFWEDQQRLILRYAFFPFLFYFTTAQIYYFECMLTGVGQEVGILQEFCSAEDDCHMAETIEPPVRFLFFILLTHQIFIEIY